MKKRDWSALVRQQSESRMSVAEFCAQAGVHPNTFYRQRKHYQVADFVEIPVRSPLSKVNGGEAIVLKSGSFSLELLPGFDEVCLKRVLSVLRELG